MIELVNMTIRKNIFVTSLILEILVLLKGQSYKQAPELVTKKSYCVYKHRIHKKKKKNVMHELVDQLHSDCFCVENKFRPVWSWFQTKQQWALLNKQVRNKAWLPQTTAKTHIKVIQNLSLLAHDCNYKSQKGGQRGRKITYWRPTWVIYNKTFSHGVMSQIKCHSQ